MLNWINILSLYLHHQECHVQAYMTSSSCILILMKRTINQTLIKITRDCRWFNIMNFHNMLKIFFITSRIMIFSSAMIRWRMIMNCRLHYINMKLNNSDHKRKNEVNCNKTAKNDCKRKYLKDESMIEVSWMIQIFD